MVWVNKRFRLMGLSYRQASKMSTALEKHSQFIYKRRKNGLFIHKIFKFRWGEPLDSMGGNVLIFSTLTFSELMICAARTAGRSQAGSCAASREPAGA